jgi:tRNA dimethylallyltransferase
MGALESTGAVDTMSTANNMPVGQPGEAPLRPLPPALFISLEPADRSWLHTRIAQRFDQMLDQGFLDEVRQLRERGGLTPELPSMRCVGYRQAWEWLDAQGSSQPQDLAALRERGVAATRQLAKRQITWLRSMAQRQVVHGDDPQASEQVLRAVEAAWTTVTRQGTEDGHG